MQGCTPTTLVGGDKSLAWDWLSRRRLSRLLRLYQLEEYPRLLVWVGWVCFACSRSSETNAGSRRVLCKLRKIIPRCGNNT